MIAYDTEASVVVVDLNWRRPTPEKDGVENAARARRRRRARRAARRHHPADLEPRLSLVPAGEAPVARRPALAGSKALATVLDELEERFDHLLLDLPPVLATSEAMNLSQLADSYVLVVRQGVDDGGQVEAALEEMQGGEVLGVILNRFDSQHPEAAAPTRRDLTRASAAMKLLLMFLLATFLLAVAGDRRGRRSRVLAARPGVSFVVGAAFLQPASDLSDEQRGRPSAVARGSSTSTRRSRNDRRRWWGVFGVDDRVRRSSSALIAYATAPEAVLDRLRSCSSWRASAAFLRPTIGVYLIVFLDPRRRRRHDAVVAVHEEHVEPGVDLLRQRPAVLNPLEVLLGVTAGRLAAAPARRPDVALPARRACSGR